MDADDTSSAPTSSPSALDRAERAMTQARGEPADARWATAAASRLLLDGVDEPHLLRALGDVAEQVRRSGEAPDDLFGDPDLWAREQQERWLEDGVDAVPEEPLESPRQVVVGGLVAGAAFAVVMALVHAAFPGRTPLGWSGLALPAALGIAVMATHAAYRRLIRARSQVAALLAVGAGVAVVSTGVAAVLVDLAPQPADGVSAWWLLAVAAASAGLAVVVDRLPTGSGAEPETAVVPTGASTGTTTSDERWCYELAVALRERGGFPDRRIARLVEEARAYGADSGRPLLEEFGPARLHARRYPQDPRVADRRETVVWAALATFPLLRIMNHVREDNWGLTTEPVLLTLWAGAALLLAAFHGRRWWQTSHRANPPKNP